LEIPVFRTAILAACGTACGAAAWPWNEAEEFAFNFTCNSGNTMSAGLLFVTVTGTIIVSLSGTVSNSTSVALLLLILEALCPYIGC
jgi:hypothetical protein